VKFDQNRLTRHIPPDVAARLSHTECRIQVVTSTDQQASRGEACLASWPVIWPEETEQRNPQASYNRARYYDPTIGRFLSEDPIGFKGGVDFYAYVLNNPTDYADPTGWKTSVCCRRLRYIVCYVGLNHCYVKVENSNGTHTYGLHREDANGVLYPGGPKPVKDDPTDKGGTCADVPSATPCKEHAFEQAFNNVPNCQSCGNNYFFLTTNSNYWVSNTLGIFGMAAPAFLGGDNSPGYQPRTPGGFGEK